MVYIHKDGATVLVETLGIKNSDLKDKFMCKSLRLILPGYRHIGEGHRLLFVA